MLAIGGAVATDLHRVAAERRMSLLPAAPTSEIRLNSRRADHATRADGQLLPLVGPMSDFAISQNGETR